MENSGKIILLVGMILVISGLIIWLFSGKFGWFGNLPGDIKIVKEGFRFYAPLATMLLVSVFLTILIWLIRKFF